MRILYVCSDFGIPFDGTKGASVHLRAITRALAGLGHEVRLLSPRAIALDDHPAQVVPLKSGSSSDRCAKELKHWLEARDFCGHAGRELRSLLFNARAVACATEALCDHRPDVIIERLSLYSHVGVELAEAFEVPLLVEVNAPLTEESTAFRSLQMKELADSIERRVLDRADAVLPVSRLLGARLIADGVNSAKVVVVPNGVDAQWLTRASSPADCRARFGLGENFVIGFTGSFKAWHGVDTLITAFAMLHRRHPQTRLLLVGKGPEESALKELAVREGVLDSVHFSGAVPHEEVPSYLAAMDVAVAPFRWAPSFYFSPIKLFEYMGAGKCVVASRLGQLDEILQHGVNGLTCEPNNPQELAATIEKTLASDSLREKLSTRARSDVLSQYTWSHAARVVCGAIDETLSGHGAGTNELSQVEAWAVGSAKIG